MEQLDFDGSERYCIFQCHEQWYGISALDVQGVSPRPEIRNVPNSDPVLSGVSHLHNNFVPVVSLRALAQINYEQDSESQQQLLTLPGPTGPWGVLIDQVISLAPLEVSISSFSNASDQWSKVLSGSASYRNQVVQILDAKALYQYASSMLERFWQHSTSGESTLLVT
jgi:chemotaxis signal transduction protein